MYNSSDIFFGDIFITEIIKKDQSKEMLKQDFPITITLGDLVLLEGAPPIPDSDWQQQDEKRKRKAFEAKLDLPLFGKL